MNETYLAHYGVKGQKWGIRRTPEQLGHDRVFKQSNGGNYKSSDVVFVSGKVKFDEPVPSTIKRELDRAIAAKSKIIIGDAPGADTRVQDYLSEVGYKNVTVYTTDDKVRNNVGNWKVEKISGEGYETEREVRRQKDIAMTNASTKGIAISSDDDRADSATALNIQRLIDADKSVQFYDFKKDTLSENEVSGMTHSAIDETYLAHYGVKGMKWGVRRTPEQLGHRTKSGGDKPKNNSSKPRVKDVVTKQRVNDGAEYLAIYALMYSPYLAMAAGVAAEKGYKWCRSKGYAKERDKAEIDPKTGMKLKSKELSWKEDVKRVNPDYYTNKNEVTHNCMLCTSCYDLRRRGYDVTAGKTEAGFVTNKITEWYPKAKIKKVSGTDEYGRFSAERLEKNVTNTLLSQGEGARGNLCISWKGTFSGHSMVYEVRDGKVNYIDAQSGQSNVKSSTLFKQINDGVEYARLDNVDFDPKRIKGVIEE